MSSTPVRCSTMRKAAWIDVAQCDREIRPKRTRNAIAKHSQARQIGACGARSAEEVIVHTRVKARNTRGPPTRQMAKRETRCKKGRSQLLPRSQDGQGPVSLYRRQRRSQSRRL